MKNLLMLWMLVVTPFVWIVDAVLEHWRVILLVFVGLWALVSVSTKGSSEDQLLKKMSDLEYSTDKKFTKLQGELDEIKDRLREVEKMFRL